MCVCYDTERTGAKRELGRERVRCKETPTKEKIAVLSAGGSLLVGGVARWVGFVDYKK